MPEFFQQLREQVLRIWAAASPSQKVIFITIPSVILLLLMGVMFWAGSPQLEVLYAGLSPEEAGRIENALERQGIKYKLGHNGTAILVPANIKHQVRIDLAADEQFRPNLKGYSLFDQPRIGITEKELDIRYKQALEEELAMGIMAIEGIKWAQVILNLPKPALFKEMEKPPTASVVLRADRKLDQAIVKAIARHISFAIEGMEPANVHISDVHYGTLEHEMGDEVSDKANTRMELQQKMERYLEEKALNMLTKVVGPEQAIIRVSLEMNLDESEWEKLIYDHENPAVLSEEKNSEETTTNVIPPGGEPGVSSNIGEKTVTSGKQETHKTSEQNTTNYQYSRSLHNLVEAPGKIKRMSVSVQVNEKQTEDETGKITWEKRSDEEMAILESMVKAAVGFDSQRDGSERFHIAQLRFDTSLQKATEKLMQQRQRLQLMRNIMPVVVLLVIVIISYILLRKLVLMKPEEEEAAEVIPTPGKELSLWELGLGEVGDISSLPAEEQRRLRMYQQVRDYANKTPEEVAEIIKTWMSE